EAPVAPGRIGTEDGQLTVLGDTAYGTGGLREHLAFSGHAAVIKPPPLPRAIPGGFTIDDFTVHDQAGTVTCPAGHTVALGRPQADRNRAAQFNRPVTTSECCTPEPGREGTSRRPCPALPIRQSHHTAARCP